MSIKNQPKSKQAYIESNEHQDEIEICKSENIESTDEFMPFGDFYSEIRSHFSNNSWDYDKYKMARNNKERVAFLVNHKIVKKSLETLDEKVTQAPKCALFGRPQGNHKNDSGQCLTVGNTATDKL